MAGFHFMVGFENYKIIIVGFNKLTPKTDHTSEGCSLA